MGDNTGGTALDTLDGLEDRIRRVAWYLSGSDSMEEALQEVAAKGRDRTASARLATLENDLEKLSAQSAVIRDLLSLRESALGAHRAVLIFKCRCQISRPLPS